MEKRPSCPGRLDPRKPLTSILGGADGTKTSSVD